MQLINKTAVVTGAASGIGKEIARHFSNEGARVAIADIDLDAAQTVAAELDPSGTTTFALAMDVTDEAQAVNGFDQFDGKLTSRHIPPTLVRPSLQSRRQL
jgi:3-hydroxybutyrate dehydrogenase